MACNSIIASAPGSIMLFGEHAVLENHLAIATAVTERIQVKLDVRNDKIINISSVLGHYQTSTENLHIKKPFQFILGSLQHYQSQLIHGLDITVTSNMSDQKGYGSSAAVTVAMVAALEYLFSQTTDKEKIFLNSRKIIQSVQGRGSGTDALASTMGGIVAYKMMPLFYKCIPVSLPLHLVYCGYKKPTAEVIQIVNEMKKQDPQSIAQIFLAINEVSQQAMLAIQNRDLAVLGELMLKHQAYQKQLGVSDSTLEAMIDICHKKQVYGSKISGSGLGDCIVTLGSLPPNTFPIQQLPYTEQLSIQTDLQGVFVYEYE